jgi:hypothetical protein
LFSTVVSLLKRLLRKREAATLWSHAQNAELAVKDSAPGPAELKMTVASEPSGNID